MQIEKRIDKLKKSKGRDSPSKVKASVVPIFPALHINNLSPVSLSPGSLNQFSMLVLRLVLKLNNIVISGGSRKICLGKN